MKGFMGQSIAIYAKSKKRCASDEIAGVLRGELNSGQYRADLTGLTADEIAAILAESAAD